ncbi:hypothetical protein E308F_25560 [Moorella sp. E308F]|uniref:hypothetical protein n=1 Tax=Moorella sp. E308F TaxID=2572682 RepID=UPI0010FFBE53|nr:hypothetical protein [Moorella sp. E308F]GEA16312.1 hypothetical protein E308F_25560 [Moorella sp. E308F]
MRKGIVALMVSAAFVAGAAAGFGGGYYKYVVEPQKQAVEMAKKQQEEMNRMVRRGTLTAVEPGKITLKVEDGGGDIGQELTLSLSEDATLQVGMNFIDEDGKAGVTKWFKPGDAVSVLAKDGEALALYRPARPGEEIQEGGEGGDALPSPEAGQAQGQKK